MKNIFKIIAAAGIVCLAASCEKAPTDRSGGCEAVDLGLSVKWASFNVGAQSEDAMGSYFAWGETKQKENYDWTKKGDYKWGVYAGEDSPKYGMTKYTSDVEGGDGLTVLLPKDDPATANWGAAWRTPTIDEIRELLDKTKCEWTWDGTQKGYTVKSLKTGNSIFLPAAGYRLETDIYEDPVGYYWSSSVEESYLSHSCILNIFEGYHDWTFGDRKYGFSIRAVMEY